MKVFINIFGIILIFSIIKYIQILFYNHNRYFSIISYIKNDIIYKINNISSISKIIYIINKTDLSYKIKGKNIVSIGTYLFISIIISIAIFILTYRYFSLFSIAFIVSVFSFFIPYYIIKYLLYCKKVKIERMFPNYIISLKNYTDVNNDIIEAFKRANVSEPLATYINKFNISIQKGIKIYDAFETLKSNLNMNKITQLISLLQFCYIYGGNYKELLNNFSKIQMKTILQKEKEKQKIFSAKLVLIILILLNIYILFGFVLTNNEYHNILINTFIGNVILNINILSYIFIIYMFIKLNKMED